MNTNILIEKKEEQKTENKELTIPSRIMRDLDQRVIDTAMGHWDLLTTMIHSEDLWVELFVELYEMDHGPNSLPAWLADEVATDTIVAQEICICGPNGTDADCQVHSGLITDRVGHALFLSMR